MTSLLPQINCISCCSTEYAHERDDGGPRKLSGLREGNGEHVSGFYQCMSESTDSKNTLEKICDVCHRILQGSSYSIQQVEELQIVVSLQCIATWMLSERLL